MPVIHRWVEAKRELKRLRARLRHRRKTLRLLQPRLRRAGRTAAQAQRKEMRRYVRAADKLAEAIHRRKRVMLCRERAWDKLEGMRTKFLAQDSHRKRLSSSQALDLIVKAMKSDISH